MKKRAGKLAAIFIAAAMTFTGTGFIGGAFAEEPVEENGTTNSVIYDTELDTVQLFSIDNAVEGSVVYFTSSDTGVLMYVDDKDAVEVDGSVTLEGSYEQIRFSGVWLTVILKDVTVANIDSEGSEENDYSAISVTGESNVTFELEGNNLLRGGSESAGLYVAKDASVILQSSTNGSLNATGGISKENKSGAGIGGNRDCEVGSITVESGKITAVGGPGAAGIGAGYDGGAGGTILETGTITIHGGNVKATSADGAGIGAGSNGQGESQTAYDNGRSLNNGTIIIDGGTVEATGHCGIGGGNHKSAGTIIISGNAVVNSYAASKGGAGIGSGLGSSKDKLKDISGATIQVNGGDITISGSARVNAYGSYDTAGIGGGLYGDSGKIRITENAVVYAKGGYRAAGIGGGYQGDANEIEISGNAEVRAFGGTGIADKDAKSGGAGIGGGVKGGVTNENSEKYTRGGNAGTISILGTADVLAVGGWGASGIGSGAELRMSDAEKDYEIRHTQGGITIGGSAKVSAFSDGTKWAVDLEYANVTADDLAEENVILQGRFRSNDAEAGLLSYEDKDKMVKNDTILDRDSSQSNGAYPVMSGESYAASTNTVKIENSVFQMPVNYRSFAQSGFQSGRQYAISLTSNTYLDEKWISGVTVDGGRLASDDSPVTDAKQRKIIYQTASIGSSDDLAFTIDEPKPENPVEPEIPGEPETPEGPETPGEPETPEGPETPEEPETPEQPVTPPEAAAPELVQPTPEPFPDEIEETIGEEEIPLAQLPDQPDEASVTIVDEDVPLGKLPTTGFAAYHNVSGVSFLLAGAAAVLAGVFFVCSRREKRKNTEE